MRHESDSQASDENDSPAERQLASEVERLLGDAYHAPAVPASLLQRLDRQITREWGRSPELVVTRVGLMHRAVRIAARGTRVLRIAACVALVVGAVIFFGRGSSAYAWTSMVRAIEQQGVVQIDGPGVKRWLSLAEGVLSDRSEGVLTLVDVRQRVVLERGAEEVVIHRRPLSAEWSAAERDRLVLAFLLGNATSIVDSERLKGAHLIEEKWQSVNHGDGKAVMLSVRWEINPAERIDLQLTLDPQTHLLTACERPGADAAASLKCSYPSAVVSQLRDLDFPGSDVIVDVDVDEQGRPINPLSNIASNALAKPPRRNETRIASIAAAVAVDNRIAEAIPAAWQPVEITSRSRQEVIQQIDQTLEELWRANGIEPALAADDEELLRRVFLDLCGRTPSVHEIRTYLADKSPARYERLVDRLLKHRDHASHLATIWRTFLIPDGIDLTAFGGIDAFDKWLADRFGKNDSYDSVVRGLLLAEGRLSRSGPLLFYSAAKLDPDLLAARSARVFLGMRLECAQCHDHPFEPWKQEDFWAFAAFFAQISRPQGDLKAASTVMQVRDVDRGEVKLPKSETVVAPRFLNGDVDTVSLDSKPGTPPDSRRQQLARWLTSAENPYFTRATANRVWAMMFGKGIVDPVDDFGIRHKPKSGELLELLASHFASTKFDLRDLFRTIALSRAYRLSSGAATADPSRSEWFAQMNVKTFSAEQVYDCMAVATMLDVNANNDAAGFNLARAGNSDRDLFLQQFRTPSGRSTEYQGGIPQALTLMNGTLIDNATGLAKSGLLKSLEAPFFTNKQRLEVIYLAVLSRHPRPAEWQVLDTYVNDATPLAELRENLSDILWALLNSAEFTMNH